MKIRAKLRKIALLGLVMGATVATACSDGDDVPTMESGGAAQTITSAGGTVAFEQVTLEIPAGALDAPREIRITKSTEAVPAGYETTGPIYRFEPDGLQFRRPVTVRFANAAADATVIWSTEAGFEPLDTTREDGRARAEVRHFSRGFVGRPRCKVEVSACTLNAQCTYFSNRCHGEQRELRVDCTCATGSGWSCATHVSECGGQDGGVTDDASTPDSSTADTSTADTSTDDASVDASIDANADAATEAGPDAGSGWQSIVMSSTTLCGIRDGAVLCAGSNVNGSFGNGTAGGESLTPVSGAVGKPLVALSNGGNPSCGLTTDGRAFCWGSNDHGQAGPVGPSYISPRELFAGTTFTAISGGRSVSCALAKSDASAWCWGSPPQQPAPEVTPQIFPGPWTALSSGPGGSSQCGGYPYQNLICALDPMGKAYCWSTHNCYGELGQGTGNGNAPTLIDNARRFKTISAGAWTACAVDLSGVGWCWGMNGQYAVLGTGSTTTPNGGPARVAGSQTWKEIHHGTFHACGVTTLGQVYCWGSNRYGALGQATLDDAAHPTPVLVPGLPAIATLTAFDFGTCALSTTHERWCWGHDGYGRFGDGAKNDLLSPTKLP